MKLGLSKLQTIRRRQNIISQQEVFIIFPIHRQSGAMKNERFTNISDQSFTKCEQEHWHWYLIKVLCY